MTIWIEMAVLHPQTQTKRFYGAWEDDNFIIIPPREEQQLLFQCLVFSEWIAMQ